MTNLLRMLMVEDSEDDAELLAHELRRAGFALEFERVDNAAALAAALDRVTWDVIIGDNSMPGFSGTEALALLRARGLDIPFIFVSGTMGEDLAARALDAGAGDALTKGNLRRLIPGIRRELREFGERRARRETEGALRVSEATYSPLVEQAPLGIYRSTPAGPGPFCKTPLDAILSYRSRTEALDGGVAHDFNTLLNVILSYSELLLEELPKDSSNRDDIGQIRKAAQGASELTRQLLAFSRQQVLEPKVVDLNAAVTGIERLLGRVLREDIQLRCTLAADAGTVRVDPGQLEQVIMNLAVNARDAMPNGGRLTVETANVDLDETDMEAHPLAGPRRCGHV